MKKYKITTLGKVTLLLSCVALVTLVASSYTLAVGIGALISGVEATPSTANTDLSGVVATDGSRPDVTDGSGAPAGASGLADSPNPPPSGETEDSSAPTGDPPAAVSDAAPSGAEDIADSGTDPAPEQASSQPVPNTAQPDATIEAPTADSASPQASPESTRPADDDEPAILGNQPADKLRLSYSDGAVDLSDTGKRKLATFISKQNWYDGVYVRVQVGAGNGSMERVQGIVVSLTDLGVPKASIRANVTNDLSGNAALVYLTGKESK